MTAEETIIYVLLLVAVVALFFCFYWSWRIQRIYDIRTSVLDDISDHAEITDKLPDYLDHYESGQSYNSILYSFERPSVIEERFRKHVFGHDKEE